MNKAVNDLIISLSDLDTPKDGESLESWLARAIAQEIISSKDGFDIKWVYPGSEPAAGVIGRAETELLAA